MNHHQLIMYIDHQLCNMIPCIVSLETWKNEILIHKQEHDTNAAQYYLHKKQQGAVVASGKLPCHLSNKLPVASKRTL